MTRLMMLVRSWVLLGGCAAGAVGSWWLAREPLTVAGRAVLGGSTGSLPLQTVVEAGCAAALLGCVGWLLATTTLAMTAYVAPALVPGSSRAAALGRAAERRCPAGVRHAVATALGAAMTVAVAGPSLADPPSPHGLTGLALPDRTTDSAPAPAAPPFAGRAVPHRSSHPVLVVRPGDSLWAMAAGQLPNTASDLDITRAWHRLHQANADRIGPDPDLILPGTRLVPPDLDTPHRKGRP